MDSKIKLLLVILMILMITINVIFYFTIDKPSINNMSDNQLYVQLVSIKGIGDVYAKAIVDYRDKHSRITLDELINVKGIKQERLKLIKEKFKE